MLWVAHAVQQNKFAGIARRLFLAPIENLDRAVAQFRNGEAASTIISADYQRSQIYVHVKVV